MHLVECVELVDDAREHRVLAQQALRHAPPLAALAGKGESQLLAVMAAA